MAYLEQNVDDKDIEHIFERIDDTVEHSLEFGYSFDGFEGSQNTENTKRFDRAEVLSGRTSPET